jgi:hypothetical protein
MPSATSPQAITIVATTSAFRTRSARTTASSDVTRPANANPIIAPIKKPVADASTSLTVVVLNARTPMAAQTPPPSPARRSRAGRRVTRDAATLSNHAGVTPTLVGSCSSRGFRIRDAHRELLLV